MWTILHRWHPYRTVLHRYKFLSHVFALSTISSIERPKREVWSPCVGALRCHVWSIGNSISLIAHRHAHRQFSLITHTTHNSNRTRRILFFSIPNHNPTLRIWFCLWTTTTMIAAVSNNKRQGGGGGGVFLDHFMTIMKPARILSSMLLMLVSSSALLLAAESENVGVSSFNNKGFEQDAASSTNTYAAGKRVLVSDIVSSMAIYYNISNASFSHLLFTCHSVALVLNFIDTSHAFATAAPCSMI